LREQDKKSLISKNTDFCYYNEHEN
jgi:hypothetical protein